MIPLADFVRMPKGATQTYLLESGDESPFLKKLATYCARAHAKIEYDIWLCIRARDDRVQRMIVCKIVIAGRKRKRRSLDREISHDPQRE